MRNVTQFRKVSKVSNASVNERVYKGFQCRIDDL